MQYLKELLKYLKYAPETEKKKFYNSQIKFNEYCEKNNISQQQNTSITNTDFIYKGIAYKNNKFYALNIYTFNPNNNYYPQYLDITKIFHTINKKCNIFHTFAILNRILAGHCRDSTLTENILIYIKYNTPYTLPKFKYTLKKHKNRYGKHIDNTKYPTHRIWYKILYKSFSKIQNLYAFTKQRTERPDSIFINYTTIPKLYSDKYSNKPPYDLP